MIHKFTIAIIILFSASALAADKCENPISTLEINNCLTLKMEKSEQILNKYFEESKNRYAEYSEVLAAISNSQKGWIKYREAHCDAIYQIYKEGTIRGVMYGNCMMELTFKRTHELWQSYLTYQDSTPPILPEPKKSLSYKINLDGN